MKKTRFPRFLPAIACLILCSANLSAESRYCGCALGGFFQKSKVEEIDGSDVVLLVQWIEGKKAKGQEPGNTTYEITQVVKGHGTALKKGRAALIKGKRITLASYHTAKNGGLFLLMGSPSARIDARIEWCSPLKVTETSFNYIAHAPSLEETPQKRLLYFLKFLEFPDPLIAEDAYLELNSANFKDIVPLKDLLPRKNLQNWITNPQILQTRLEVYGMLLGICGKPEDAELMKKIIIEPTDDFRLGIDGVMFGYLLLTGAEGLDLIDQFKLKNTYVVDKNRKPVLDKDGKKKPLPFSETYSAMMALQNMWTYGEGRISKERLRQSMRILLDRPELTDLVILNLARWEDWSVQDKLMDLYGAKEYNIPSIKRAIVRYMLVSSKDSQVAVEDSKPPAHVIKGRKHMAALRKKDAKTVREAERFFFLK